MTIKTGIDIIEVERIKKAIEDLGYSFLTRIYTEKEIDYCMASKSMRYQHFAARFAVKEAVYKAISENITSKDDSIWKSIEVINLESGRPEINVEKLNQNICKTADNKVISIDISISHIKEYAVANAVVVYEKM